MQMVNKKSFATNGESRRTCLNLSFLGGGAFLVRLRRSSGQYCCYVADGIASLLFLISSIPL
jgi:hypothetical protein